MFAETELSRSTEDILGKGRDIVNAVTQRRQGHSDDCQAIEQIFSECAQANGLLQILVGGGEESNVRVDRVGAADSIKCLILQDPQQVTLQR